MVKRGLVISCILLVLFLVPLASSGIFQDMVFSVNGTATSDNLGFNIQGGYDFNGDGYDDFFSSAPFGNSGDEKVYLFYGGPDLPLNLTRDQANITFVGRGDSTGFGGRFLLGSSVNVRGATFAGDFNNDSYYDLAVGSYLEDTNGISNNGQLFIFYGATDTNATWSYLDANVTINGTYADEYFPLGGASGSQPVGFTGTKEFGDFNGDGIDDLVMGTNGLKNLSSGMTDVSGVYVFYGADGYVSGTNVIAGGHANITIYDINTNASDSNVAVMVPGDLNNDSIDDFAFAIPNQHTGGNGDTGRVVLFFGNLTAGGQLNLSDADANFTLNGTAANHRLCVFGYLGDMSGDGIDDLMLAEPLREVDAYGTTSNYGAVEIFFGVNDMPNRDYQYSSSNTNFTVNGSMASAVAMDKGLGIGSDVNSDGINDLVLGLTRGGFNGNFTEVFYGTADLVTASSYVSGSANITLNGSSVSGLANYGTFGLGVAVWDYDNDTFDEIVVGDPYFGSGVGRVTIFEVMDDYAPNFNWTSPDNSSTFTTTNISINVSVNDIVGTGARSGVDQCWFVNYTAGTTFFDCLGNITFLSQDCAYRNVTIYVNDSINNINNTEVIFFNVETSACTPSTTSSTTSSSGGGSSDTTVSTVTAGEVKNLGRLSTFGSKREMSADSEVTFIMPDGEKHSAKVRSVDKDKGEVVIDISSTPQTITLKVGETKEVDLGSDNRGDISVSLEEITDAGNAVLKFVRLSGTQFIKGHKSAEAAAEGESDGSSSLGEAIADSAVGKVATSLAWWVWLIIVLVIVGAGVGYYIYHSRY